jgi:hypothetical protein
MVNKLNFNRVSFNCGIMSSLVVMFLFWTSNDVSNLVFIFVVLLNLLSAILNFNMAFTNQKSTTNKEK